MLASVPHTGTFFVEHFLRNHKDVAHTVGIGPVLKSQTLLKRRIGPKAWEEGLEPGYTTCMQAHLTEANWKVIQTFALFNPLVIPMRDPLAALLSTVARNPGNDPMVQVRAFIRLVTDILSMQHVYCPYFIPVDRLSVLPKEERVVALSGLQVHCNIPVDGAYTAETAVRWCPVNSGGAYPLKNDYRAGNKEPIWAALGKEIGELQAKEGILRPFLKKLGYRKLLWWS